MTITELYEHFYAQCLDAGLSHDEAHKVATETAREVSRMERQEDA